MKLLVIILILSFFSFELIAEVAGHDGAFRANIHRTAPSKLCVCQYQEIPVRCETVSNEKACRALHKECRFIKGKRDNSVCRNHFQDYCEVGFQRRSVREGCTTTQIIGSLSSPPACDTPSMLYYYEGHGRGTAKFLGDAKSIIKNSSPTCQKLEIEDGGCSTFDINEPNHISSLYDAREQIVAELVPLVKQGQTVSVRGSQKYVTGNPETSNIHFPYYEFNLDSTGLGKENVPPCKDANEWACSKVVNNQRYLCDTGSGIKRNTCCCKGEKCSWKLNILKCT